MEITEKERLILSEMARYLKDQNRIYTRRHRLEEQFLSSALPILLELKGSAGLLPVYVKTLKRQSRLVTVYGAYLAGKQCGQESASVRAGFLAYLCSALSNPQAEELDNLLWHGYHEITAQLSHPERLDELTGLYREMRSYSEELSLEVFEAGYIAGLCETGKENLRS